MTPADPDHEQDEIDAEVAASAAAMGVPELDPQHRNIQRRQPSQGSCNDNLDQGTAASDACQPSLDRQNYRPTRYDGC